MNETRATYFRRLPSALGLASRLAYQRARRSGVTLRPLPRRAQFTGETLENPDARVAVRDQIDFLNLAAEALGDEMLGFHLAKNFELRLGGLFYYVLASSQSLLELFQRGARYTSLVNEGVSQSCIDARRIGMSLGYVGVRRQTDRHQMEFWLTTLVRICRECTGVAVKPERVRVTHYRARGHAAWSKFLGCSVEFGAPVDEILFSRELRNLRITRSDPYLNKLLVRTCEEVLARRSRVIEPFVARVENVMAPLLPHGDARSATIAARLGMSQRTFARRLAEQGLTFSAVLHRMRLQLARRYLLQEKMPVSKVAWLLGYREVGAFSHAFRRWTGKSPREFAGRSR